MIAGSLTWLLLVMMIQPTGEQVDFELKQDPLQRAATKMDTPMSRDQ